MVNCLFDAIIWNKKNADTKKDDDAIGILTMSK